MYSLVMLAAMTAGPDLPGHYQSPVTPSNYGNGFWTGGDFFECCAPARYGWVTCWTKGFGYYPGAALGLGEECAASHPSFYRPAACCGACGSAPGGGCGWCGYGWSVACQPAYYTSVIGCPPHLSAPPYANYRQCNPCCNLNFAFDTGLIGLAQGAGYAGFGGFGNFGYYGAMPMRHPPTTADLPPFPHPEYRIPGYVPSGPAPMPPLPKGPTPPAPPKGIELPPKAPDKLPPPGPKKDEPKKDEPKKTDGIKTELQRPEPATVILCVPAGATVTVDGVALRSTGRERTFQTPDLEPGHEFAYPVRVSLTLNGREEVETKHVIVRAGEISRASFERLFALVEGPTGRPIADAKPNR
ncbi:MAG TPA: TIGR03000 domain-containing protein [Gemmataceae bacterium]|nr:TIGR03000 domain-containing protein [Gemmataceae bacterium]